MGFIKVIKNKAYFKRYQVKFRRRRECRTDYYARQRLTIQDKNKYKTPKFRLVFRRTNRDIIMQIVQADFDHDKIIASAYSHELTGYGIKAGLTNYAAAYATGLLLARRVQAEFKLDYEGVVEPTGEHFDVESEEYSDEKAKKPFKAVLDVGLSRTTTGARIFGGLKGACDGGLHIPHSDKRFPGSHGIGGSKYEANPEKHREYIFGGHVANYMTQMQENDAEKYASHFSRYIKAGVTADSLEDMYTAAHAAIRANPARTRTATQKGYFADSIKSERSGAKGASADYPKKQWRSQKLSVQQRKGRIKQKLLAAGVVSLPKLVLQR